jgi:hypothetical protein
MKKAKKLTIIFLCASVALVIYFKFQNDLNIKTALEVKQYLYEFCAAQARQPSLAEFNSRFPKLTRHNDWYFWSQQHDPKLLKIQYPVVGRREDAPGTSKVSEFTATVYAYVMESKCSP